ncbi:MAG: nicotinate phosphoribosyltransferase [Planctomycetota bacterium]
MVNGSGQSLSMLTDLYQLTMSAGYLDLDRAEEEAVFNLFFRRHPFRGGYTLAAGLQQVIELVEGFRFDGDDIRYLGSLKGNDDTPLFKAEFLEYLSSLKLTVDIDAVPEGTIVFPHQPIVRVKGPILQCQLLETALLNIINFQTLVATKASRVAFAAQDELVLEFGLRRAQGIDGALAASRAAFLGGCSATSNVLAGKLFGIPVKGTHAHSWVMSFDDEQQSFSAYADSMPNNCVFLVDTYDTLDGVRKAIEVGQSLRARGNEMVGIRLDSGDLAYLSIEARKMLDSAGFPNASIVASNDLDEHIIDSLKRQGATIAVWGVGTKLVTAYDQPALGGVYKLAALKGEDGIWMPKIKLSEQSIKVSTPGILQVRRFSDNGRFVADAMFDEQSGLEERPVIIDPSDPVRQRRIDDVATYEDLLVPITRGGEIQYDSPPLQAIRERAGMQLSSLHAGVKRFENPHSYPAGLEQGLYKLRESLIRQARGASA